jgi:Tfp pilus assembly protein PilF
MDKGSTESFIALGYLDLSANNLTEAKIWFASALDLNSRLDTAKRGLAQYYLCAGDPDETLRLAGAQGFQVSHPNLSTHD